MCTTQSWTSAPGNRLLVTGNKPEKSSCTTMSTRRRPRSIKLRRTTFQVLAADLRETSQHSFLAISAETEDQINTGGFEAIAVADFDVLAIEKQGQQVGIQWTSVAQLQFFDETGSDFFQLLFGTGQTHFVQSIAGGRQRPAGTEQAEQQRLSFLAIATLIARGQRGWAKLPAAGAWDLHFDGYRSDQQRAGIKAVGFVLRSALQIGASFGVNQARKQCSQELAQAEIA